MTKVTLESKILHLYTSDKKESGLVILLDQNGKQIGSVFDLHDSNSKEKLIWLFNQVYFSQEKLIDLANAVKHQEQENFAAAKKISLASYYESGLNHFYRDGGVFEADSVDNPVWDRLRKSSVEWVWGVKKGNFTYPSATEIWEFFLDSNLQPDIETVPGSEELLDQSLAEFFKTNEFKLNIYEADYNTAVLL